MINNIQFDQNTVLLMTPFALHSVTSEPGVSSQGVTVNSTSTATAITATTDCDVLHVNLPQNVPIVSSVTNPSLNIPTSIAGLSQSGSALHHQNVKDTDLLHVQWLLDNYECAEGVSLPRSTLYNHYVSN